MPSTLSRPLSAVALAITVSGAAVLAQSGGDSADAHVCGA